ncbi:hypothetical protein TRIUR3_06398 [Triticum urartu]|uniref:Uncharacterized protein n=1 Tax=Triticum urartu TaxID=4572 RepID=M7YTJ2_TRIUA|nr:hypothetical protein TRIUR3_06398 [Triticum urartu]
MDSGDAWGRSSSTSSSAAAARRLQSRYDLYMGFDDADAGGDEVEARGAEAYNCPFCGEDFDFVGLCCHIDDEHAVEAKSGIAEKMRFLNVLLENSCFSVVVRVGNVEIKFPFGWLRWNTLGTCSLDREFLYGVAGWNCGMWLASGVPTGVFMALGNFSFAPDPFLQSLICSLPVAEPSKDFRSDSSDKTFLLNKFPDEKVVERAETSLSEKDQKERAQRSAFARGLVLSTIFDDDTILKPYLEKLNLIFTKRDVFTTRSMHQMENDVHGG